MSTFYTGSSEPDLTTVESDTLFAATPVWERGRKRRGFGKSKAAAPVATRETLTPSPTADQLAARELRAERLRETPVGGPAASAPHAAPVATRPVYTARAKPTKRGLGMVPMAVGAGVIVLAGLAAAGFYATRDDGVVELTPGNAATSTAALDTAPMTAAPAPTEMAANSATPPAAARTTTTVSRETTAPRRTTATTTRTRPTPALSASEAGVNTAATLPAAPMPYAATVDGASAPTTVNPAAAPPVLAIPAPSATEAATGPSTPSAAPAQPSTLPDTSAVPPTATPPVISNPTP